VVVLFALLALALPVACQADPTVGSDLEALERREAIGDLRTELDRFDVMIRDAARRWQYDCLKIVGHTRFCSCLGERVPVWTSFGDYSAIVLVGDAAVPLQIDDPKNRKGIVDTVRDARRICVTESRFQ
jgi:hypothetical protein